MVISSISQTTVNYREQFKLAYENLPKIINIYRNRDDAYYETNAVQKVIPDIDQIDTNLWDNSYPNGNGVIIECPSQYVLVFFKTLDWANFTLLTDWQPSFIKDNHKLIYNNRYSLLDLEYEYNNRSSVGTGESHVGSLKDNITIMFAWHPRYNLYEIIQYILKANKEWGGADNPSSFRYNFLNDRLPRDVTGPLSKSQTMNYVIRRYIFCPWISSSMK